MDKNQTSQRAHAGARAANRRQPFGLRLFLAASLLALIVTSFQPPAFAQGCSQQCQQAYVECLRGAIGEPGPLLMCDDQYDACWQACL